MIEIPESVMLSKQLNEAFEGAMLVEVEAAHSPHGFAFYNHDAAEYKTLLTGKIFRQAAPNGGQIEVIFDDMHFVMNDGVNIKHLSDEERSPDKHQFYARFNNGEGFYCTVSMYAGFMVYPQGKSDNFYYLVGHEKPSPLSSKFDENYFESLFSQTPPKLSTKAFLATEQRIPGLGNGVLQDILFNAQIHPQRKLQDFKVKDIERLYSATKETLSVMAEKGGRDTEKDIYGNPGGYRTILSNKTKDRPCPRCGGPITKKAYLGGNVYFCPNCQPL